MVHLTVVFIIAHRLASRFTTQSKPTSVTNIKTLPVATILYAIADNTSRLLQAIERTPV